MHIRRNLLIAVILAMFIGYILSLLRVGLIISSIIIIIAFIAFIILIRLITQS